MEKSIPQASALQKDGTNYDYIDSFHSVLPSSAPPLTRDHLLYLFMHSGPPWVDFLFRIRNLIAKRLGLKVSEENPAHAYEKPRQVGERAGLFKVYGATDNEYILGEDDTHLDFRVSLLITPPKTPLQAQEIAITTVVKYHKLLGRCYFFPVSFFHRLIVRSSLGRILKSTAQTSV